MKQPHDIHSVLAGSPSKESEANDAPAVDIWRYLNSISLGGDNLVDDPLFGRPIDFGGYNPFLVNNMLSRYPDTLPFAYAMNRAIVNGLSHRDHYLYLYYTVPKKKRWSGRMNKYKHQEDKVIDAISDYTKENKDRAREYMRFLSEEQQKMICDAKGGVKRDGASKG